jgi:hypothetical protein
MERYLAALDAHDVKQLPLARGARFTENTVALTLGDGFWQTIDKGIVYPNSMAMTEAFRIRNGKVTHIVAQMVMLPYRRPTGWPVP